MAALELDMVIREVRLYEQKPVPDNEAITIVWPDEREGVAEVASLPEAESLLQFYDLSLPAVTDQFPLMAAGPDLTATVALSDNGYRVTVYRVPVGDVQEAAWQLAAETRMYQVIRRDGVLGVLFRDETVFVPFERLRFDRDRHKFRIV